MANKLVCNGTADGRGSKDVAASPQEWMRVFTLHPDCTNTLFRTAFNLCTATGGNCRSIHGNLESEDVPLDRKGI